MIVKQLCFGTAGMFQAPSLGTRLGTGLGESSELGKELGRGLGESPGLGTELGSGFGLPALGDTGLDTALSDVVGLSIERSESPRLGTELCIVLGSLDLVDTGLGTALGDVERHKRKSQLLCLYSVSSFRYRPPKRRS